MSQPGTAQPTEGADASRAAMLALCAVAAIGGTLLRIGAMGGDLWFDEIWSIAWAQWVGSPLGILTRMHVDNNHYLNTLTMWLLLPLDWHGAYRVPSVVASVVTIFLAALYGARRSRMAAIGCAVVQAFSFLLIQYGTEARGYALALCLVVAAMLALDRAPEASPRRLLVFSSIVGVGVLSHLTFLLFAIPASALLAIRIVRRGDKPATTTLRLAALVAIPAIVVATLWWFDLRMLRIAGGPESGVLQALTQLAGLVFGVWRGPLLGIAALGSFAMLLVLLVPRVRAEHRDLLVVTAASFLLGIALVPGNMAYPRYFLVPFELLLLSLGCALGTLSAPSFRRAGALGLLIVALSNVPPAIELARVGRGQYRKALSSIVERTPGEVIRVGSNQDLRNGEIIRFYAPMISGGERLSYQRGALDAGDPVDWLIFQDLVPDEPPFPELIEVRGTRYALDRSEGQTGLSGFAWHLYRRIDAGR